MARKKRTEAAPAALVGQQYKVVGIDTVKEHPKNPRRGDVEVIQESIATNAFYGAVVVQKSTGQILAGNHRWKAAKAAGLSKIPVIYLDVDDATALRILLADNRTSDEAKYDDALLLELLQQANVTPVGLDGTGYDAADLSRLLAATVHPEDTEPSVPAHEERTKMVHKCPRCAYEWAAGAKKRGDDASAA